MMIAGGVLFLIGLAVVLWQILPILGWAFPGGDDPMDTLDRVEEDQSETLSPHFAWIILVGSLMSAVGGGLFKWGLIVHAGAKAAEHFTPRSKRGSGPHPAVTHTFGDHPSDSVQAPRVEKYCANCERSYPADARFCVSCGKALSPPPLD